MDHSSASFTVMTTSASGEDVSYPCLSAEAALARFRSAVETYHCVVIIVDRDGFVVDEASLDRRAQSETEAAEEEFAAA